MNKRIDPRFLIEEEIPSAFDRPKAKHRRPQYSRKPTKLDPGVKVPKISVPPPSEFGDPDSVHTITHAWVAKHADRIRFHAERGMSREALTRIYGKSAVLIVLGDE